MVRKAAEQVDAGETAAAECNMSKLLAADASWKAADVCLQTHGGYGFATEFDIEVCVLRRMLGHQFNHLCAL